MKFPDVIDLGNTTRATMGACFSLLDRYRYSLMSQKSPSAQIAARAGYESLAIGAQYLLEILAHPTWKFNSKVTINIAERISDEMRKSMSAITSSPVRGLTQSITVTIGLEDYVMLKSRAADRPKLPHHGKALIWAHEPDLHPIL